MTQGNPEQPDRMEALLRKWGAEEAVRREGVSAPPPALLRAVRPPSPLLRWMPVAAGFVLFAVGVGLLAGSIARDAGRQVAPAASSAADIERLQADLARTNSELAATRAAMEQLKLDAGKNAPARMDIESVASAKGTDSAATAAGRGTEGSAGVAAATGTDRGTAGAAAADIQVAALKKIIGEKQASLDEASANLVARDAQVAGMKTDIEKLRSASVAAAGKLQRLEQSAQAAERDARDAAARIKALQVEQAQALALFQRVTQAARMKPDETLRTLQQAVRDARLIRRGTELRDSIPNEAVRRLFDTQEALLTQLDMIDAGNAAEIDAFLQRLKSTDIADQVTEALRTSDGDPAVRAWLIEGQLLLAGVQRAG